MPDVFAELDDLSRQAAADLATVATNDALEQYRIKYLGSNGILKAKMSLIGAAPPDQKKTVGQKLNAIKAEINTAFDAKKTAITDSAGEPGMDVTEPGLRPAVGNKHILMKVIGELTDLFGRMGFSVASGPEVEDEFHNFVALNIPESHPARDPIDNFYLDVGSALADVTKGPTNSSATQTNASAKADPTGLRLLRTQTSTVQIRVMETQKPPIRVVIPGRVYRPDTVDATHLFMFHQLEALVVDTNVTMVDLKSTVMQFVHAYFGQDAKVRFRPSFFPFTEPSAEVDVWFEDKQRWIELGGCGMVHPNVLRACNIDPEVYSGWAFGFGIERIAMRKYGITDIRYFIENDVRFLRQF
ncbi:phenylalanine--tRNA ligase subunit alpha [Humisphaera borealis]|uniref:Phenylalanine--tRNA ligase alpha subunit n=1 Tax=Humisphaera borealis TaxID=2807512 RepID=A0A7M2WXA3_9BACT|nr:phenylalanine--tRNA ligase subunit alpha [Humisphaera borealis]QOV89140.1 phenylalanine--tRNA ligase subunit alpha [Humisphaera borealis]